MWIWKTVYFALFLCIWLRVEKIPWWHSEVSIQKQYPARLFPGLSMDLTVDGRVLCSAEKRSQLKTSVHFLWSELLKSNTLVTTDSTLLCWFFSWVVFQFRAGLALFLLLQLQDLCTFASTVLLHKSCAWSCRSEVVRRHPSVLREDIFPWAPSESCSFNLGAQERKSDEEEEEEEEAVEKHRWLQFGLWTPSLDSSDMCSAVFQLAWVYF